MAERIWSRLFGSLRPPDSGVQKAAASRVFAKSPVGALCEHMAVASQASTALKPFMAAAIAADWEVAEQHSVTIADLEHQADQLKREIRLGLPRSLFLPFARSDLLELIDVQDKVANVSRDIAGLMLGRHMTVPGSIAPALIEFLDSSLQATALAAEAIDELDQLADTGFTARGLEQITDTVVRLDEAEHANDRQQVVVRRALMEIEGTINAVDVIFMYRIIDWIGDLADYSEKVGNRLMYLISK